MYLPARAPITPLKPNEARIGLIKMYGIKMTVIRPAALARPVPRNLKFVGNNIGIYTAHTITTMQYKNVWNKNHPSMTLVILLQKKKF